MAYNQANLTQKPRVISAKARTTDLSHIDESAQQSPPVHLRDYVNAFVLNEADEILVFEATDNGRSWSSWQMVGRHLETDENPILAVQQELLLRTGYTCKNWVYLGTFVIDETQKAGAGYYFCAKVPEKTLVPDAMHSKNQKLKWVAKQEIKQALLDGRIAVINHALAISLAILMCHDND
jgi:hypothetical protein